MVLFLCCLAQNGEADVLLETGSMESAHEQQQQPEMIEVPDENGDSQLMVSECSKATV